MNLKTWIPLGLAIVLGLVAMKIAKDVSSKKPTGSAAPGNLADVIVVKRNLPPGTPIKPDDLATTKMGNEIPAELVFRTPGELDGRVTKSAIYKGQPVLESLLAPKGTGSGLQALVPKGMRAITVEINEFSGLAGNLVPGCRVDVVSTLQANDNETLSRTIVQNVEVTAIGRKHPERDGQPEQVKSVTLLVKPKEAEAIELAASTGRPRLVLRGSGDNSDAATTGITVAELRGRATGKKQDPWLPVDMFTPKLPMTTPSTQPTDVTPAVDLMPLPPQQRTIRIYRGGRESETTIELPRPQPAQAGNKWITDAK